MTEKQAQQQISPQERANAFSQMTRRQFQTLGKKTGAESGMISVDLPKSRLLSNLKLMVECTLTAVHASETVYVPHADAPCAFLKRVEVSLNNGFAPFSISGQALAIYNQTLRGTVLMTSKTSGRGGVVQGLTASPSAGTANVVRFVLDLPNMVNPRDPVGLLLLQNDETLCTVNVTLDDETKLAPVSSGFTFTVSAITVSLMTDTFTVPADPKAFPDLSVLKLVQERTETMIAGENIFKLPCGQTYRKLGFILYNSSGVRLADANITSAIEMMFNQAEIPYRLQPFELAQINEAEYGGALPAGTFIFDFSDNGQPNFSGARDYIDSERLTEMWLKFTSDTAGTVKIFSETLSRLR